MRRKKKILYVCILLASFCIPLFISHRVANTESMPDIRFKEEMILLIEEIHTYAQGKNPSFQVISNNGLELFRSDSVESSFLKRLLGHVDGVLVEGLDYTWGKEEGRKEFHTITTSSAAKSFMESSLALPIASQLPVFVVDYCQEKQQIDHFYRQNSSKGYISFAGSRELNAIPDYPENLPNENNRNVSNLKQARNFLILLNPDEFKSKETYLQALENTNYDVLIIDMYFNGQPLSSQDVTALKTKKNGASRLVFAYMSVGEAENYRPYWQPAWSKALPSWIAEENPDWPGNFKVKYWTKEWRQVLLGSPESSLDRIIALGFNGVFMDVIDAYDYFENK